MGTAFSRIVLFVKGKVMIICRQDDGTKEVTIIPYGCRLPHGLKNVAAYCRVEIFVTTSKKLLHLCLYV